MNKKSLQKYIELLVENMILEKEEGEGLDLSELDNKDSKDAEVDPNISVDDSTGEIGMSDTKTDENSGEGLDLGDSDGGLDLGDTSTGLGGSSGFGGGGGGFDFSPDSKTDADTNPDFKQDEFGKLTQPNVMDDPTIETIKSAKELSNKFGDPQIILNSVKSNIQKYYDDPMDAIEIVSQLWDTEDPKLRLVASKLLMFIRGD